MKYITLLVFFPFLLTGCATFAPEAMSPQDLLPTMPTAYTTDKGLSYDEKTPAQIQEEQEKIGKAWWLSFQSKDLNSLQTKAFSDNFDIQIAWLRLEQAMALSKKADSGFFPTISLDSSAKHTITNSDDHNSPSTNTDNDSYGLGLSASYELDLWGRVYAESKASDFNLQKSAFDVQTAGLTISSSIAQAWINLLGNNAQLELLNTQILINQSLVEVQKMRFRNALNTSLDVLQQQEVLVASQAELPPLYEETIVLKNQLVILLGELPNYELSIDLTAPLPKAPFLPELGIPSDLLESRPDIQAAWANLEKSRWNVSQAQANRLPKIQLSASQAFNAASGSLLFDNWVTQFAASLAFTVFDGGELSAEVRYQKALSDESVQQYIKTVATALQEVSDAYAANLAQDKKLTLLQEQYILASNAQESSFQAYINNTNSFLQFILQLKNTQSLERNIVSQKTNVLLARINLFKALGTLYFPNSFVKELETAPSSPSK